MESLASDLMPILKDFLSAWAKPGLSAGGIAFCVVFGIEWFVHPVVALLPARWGAPLVACRQLAAFALTAAFVFHLNAEGAIDFGLGPASWIKAMLMALVGTAVMVGIKDRLRGKTAAGVPLTNETLIAAIDRLKGNGKGAPPPPPTGGTP